MNYNCMKNIFNLFIKLQIFNGLDYLSINLSKYYKFSNYSPNNDLRLRSYLIFNFLNFWFLNNIFPIFSKDYLCYFTNYESLCILTSLSTS